MTFDLDQLSKIKGKLKQNGIDYYLRVVNTNGSTLGGLGASRRAIITTVGQNMNYTHEYHLYVHKKDFEDALYLIHDI